MYSPTSTSGESLILPNFIEKTVAESLEILLKPIGEIVEFSDKSLTDWYTADSMHESYAMFSPEWLHQIKQHVV
eukprot:5429349-Amphidinium_carterae.1